MTIHVLGVDLASRSWRDNGSCILSFEGNQWINASLQPLRWPDEELTPQSMARSLLDSIRERNIAGISLDGPQGWRKPNAGTRPGVGRLCEYEARCQGKTGELETSYPMTQLGWIKFCIEVFDYLRLGGGIVPTRQQGLEKIQPFSDGNFWLVECFPTSIWRTAGLRQLPGKARCQRDRIPLHTYFNSLSNAFGLPAVTQGLATHDDLQAMVSGLAITALFNGPCKPIPRGEDALLMEHWCEGIIWDCEPLNLRDAAPEQIEEENEELLFDSLEHIGTNPLLVDERDDLQAEVFERGVKLFEELCDRANKGVPTGIGYSKFVEYLFDCSYVDLMGRNYATSDTRYVLGLSHQITNESGGRKCVSRDGTTISLGMDAFVWQQRRPHDRSDNAFVNEPFAKGDWLRIFPDGERRLIDPKNPINDDVNF